MVATSVASSHHSPPDKDFAHVSAGPRAFFDELMTTPGVSGYEEPVQRVVRDYVSAFADSVTTDLHGNVIAAVNPAAPLRIMLAGHCDQLGLLVSHIEERGFLYFQTVGGWDPQQLVGQNVTVWGHEGPVDGVVSRKAIHLLSADERTKVVDIKDLWIDIGAQSDEEANAAVRIGDPVTPRMGVTELKNGLLAGPAMDNRTGLWIVVEALRRAAERGVECGVFAVSTVQEEIGKRGAITSAFGIDPHIGIAVDVTHSTDCPTIDKRQRGTIDLGGGPVIVRGPNINPRVESRLAWVCEANDIPRQTLAWGRAAANDAAEIQINRAGVATGLVQIPNRYMHSTVETVAWSDLEHTAELLAEFVRASGPLEDYIP